MPVNKAALNKGDEFHIKRRGGSTVGNCVPVEVPGVKITHLDEEKEINKERNKQSLESGSVW